MRYMEYLKTIDYNFAEFGDYYDELPLWSAPFGLRLLDRVPMWAGVTILDVGSGTGFLTLELAQRCGQNSKVIAVDPWAAAMKRFRRKLSHLRLGNVTLIEQDITKVELPPESVDIVVSNLGVNNFENASNAMRVVFHLAKPNASLYLTTNLTGHMAEFYEVYRATLIELGKKDRLEAFDEHVYHRGTTESVSDMLCRVGFEVVDIETDSFRMRFVDGSSMLRHYFIRLGFVQGWASIVSTDDLATVFETLEHNLNLFAAEKGELVLTIPMAYIEAKKPGRTKG